MRNILQSTYSAIVTAIMGAGLAVITERTKLLITLASVILVLHTIDRHRPSSKYRSLENAIKNTENLWQNLDKERSYWRHWHSNMVKLEDRLSQVQLKAAEIRRELLQTQPCRDWVALARSMSETIRSKKKLVEAVRHIPEAVREYAQKVWLLSQRINGCADQVKKLEKSIDLMVVSECQRRIKESMREAETIGATPARMTLTGRVRRRFSVFSAVARNYETNSMV
ncbi:hypothetical protein R3P38DRAFT_3228637 [Favolaschia claudopus]|uniref:ATP synthase protein MI25 n=1 Tax=Favolaschia claudopus TaxID=2862362 RepID=A0AAV9ZQ95_9AGAR